MSRAGNYTEDSLGRGAATTVSLGNPGIVEQELSYWGRSRSAAVVLFLPALEADAIAQVLEALSRKPYVSSIVLVLSDSTAIDSDLLRTHPRQQCLRVILYNSQRLENLQSRLHEAGLRLPTQGPSRALWYALGYLLAASPAEAVAVHDSDSIQTQLLSGSLHPLLSPYAGMQICKVCGEDTAREPGPTLLSPFFEALAQACGRRDYLQSAASFFHPPSICLAFQRGLTAGLRLPEVGNVQLALLSELQRRVPVSNLCQLSAGPLTLQPDGEKCREFAALLLDNMRAEGMILSLSLAQSIKLNFQQLAQGQLASCRSKCVLDGVSFNQHRAELFIERFADIAFAVGCQLAQGRDLVRVLPSWRRAMHAFPDALTHLNAAVEQDFAELTSTHLATLPPMPVRARPHSPPRP